MYQCWLDDEQFTYATEEEAWIGFFRLVVSACAYYRDVQTVRIISDPQGYRLRVSRAFAAAHPEMTHAYAAALYDMSDTQVLAELHKPENQYYTKQEPKRPL